ncbi:STT3 domain-containing protein [Desulfonatronum lacustre]|uniref:STT3 domain-containing protein n=1 Tax=Desulfonatronum lacustre TaxID=66849 RepID=UPI00048E400E|nr:STT3 domain-containing protein [Desulfonatronum lacustre]
MLLAAILVYVLCLGLRLAELPAWEPQLHQVQGERLQTTHDAYYFLAGAKGTARPNPHHEPFFKLTRFFHVTTGMSYGDLGFWLPVFLAPLVVFPLAFLAWREGVPEAILPMGIMAGGAMGFLARTRLGYYDHDMLSLLLPVLFTTCLFFFLDYWLPKKQGGGGFALKPNGYYWPADWKLFLGACLGLGVLGWAYVGFYSSGRLIVMAIVAMGVLLTLALARDGRQRAVLCVCLGMVFLLAVNIFWGMFVLAVLTLALGPFCKWFRSGPYFWLLVSVCALAVVWAGNLDTQVSSVLRQLAKYSPVVSESNQTIDTLALPSVMQSVREARLLSWEIMAERSGVTGWLFALGVVGFVYLAWRRPLYLLFLPLLILAVGAVKLGARFTMYGGVPIGLGLGLGLALLLGRLRLGQAARTAILSAFALVAAMLLWAQSDILKPVPVLSRAYAETLLQLRESTPVDARIWTWWDYGYATQYYAERASFGDGALNTRDYLYPLALVHATSSPLQAAQVIKMVTAGQNNQWREEGTKEGPFDGTAVPWPLYLQPPLSGLREMGAAQAQAYMDDLAETRQTWQDTLPEQYILFSWQNLAMAAWIIHFGNWDVQSGQVGSGKIQRIFMDVSVDLNAGVLVFSDGNTVELDGFLSVSQGGVDEFTWDKETGDYVIYVDDLQQFLFVDKTMYDSMLVQMLLNDSVLFIEDFELVLDNSPWARVYRVR